MLAPIQWRRLANVCEVDDMTLKCEVEFGGMLCSKKGCNLPRTVTDLPAIGDKDKDDILFGIENGACPHYYWFTSQNEHIVLIVDMIEAGQKWTIMEEKAIFTDFDAAVYQ